MACRRRRCTHLTSALGRLPIARATEGGVECLIYPERAKWLVASGYCCCWQAVWLEAAGKEELRRLGTALAAAQIPRRYIYPVPDFLAYLTIRLRLKTTTNPMAAPQQSTLPAVDTEAIGEVSSGTTENEKLKRKRQARNTACLACANLKMKVPPMSRLSLRV